MKRDPYVTTAADALRTCPEAVRLREAAWAWAHHPSETADPQERRCLALERALREAAMAYAQRTRRRKP